MNTRNRVKDFRELAGLSREELSSAVGINAATIWRLEEEEGYSTSIKTGAALAVFFHTTMERLFCLDSERVPA